jgi:hypothetical protein
MRRVVCIVLLILSLCSPTLAQEDDGNNCHDPAAWMDWQERVDKHQQDQELQVLHALWMGLCFKVEKGDIGFDEAVSIFENARKTLIQQRREERQGKKPQAPL